MTETVAGVMTRCPVAVRPHTPFATVAAVLSRNGISAVPVVGRDDAGVTASALMTGPVRTVPAHATVAAATRLLTASGGCS